MTVSLRRNPALPCVSSGGSIWPAACSPGPPGVRACRLPAQRARVHLERKRADAAEDHAAPAADAVRDVRGHRGRDDREVALPLGELGEHRLRAGFGNQSSVIISSGPAAVL